MSRQAKKLNITQGEKNNEISKEFMLIIKQTRFIICRYITRDENIPEEDWETEYLYLNPQEKRITYHRTTEGQYKIQLDLEKQLKNNKLKESLKPWVRNKIKEIEERKSGKKKTDKTKKPKESKNKKPINKYKVFCKKFTK
jgi:hypothetical protein